ncbi:MAG: hypothetical protein U1E13_01080, partial [Methylophilaceae bacterium]|nr:hypothetical protein [Methylophilaceae bacterium]
MATLRVTPIDCTCNGKNVVGPNSAQNYVRAGLAMAAGPLAGSLIRIDANYIQSLANRTDIFSSQIDALLAARLVHGGSKPLINLAATLPGDVITKLFSYQ